MRMSLRQLKRYLWGAFELLRGTMDPADAAHRVFALLFLKRCSDVFEESREKFIQELVSEGCEPEKAQRLAEEAESYGNGLFVPERARWNNLRNYSRTDICVEIDRAIRELEHANFDFAGLLHHVYFADSRFQQSSSNRTLVTLLDYLSQQRLRNEDLCSPDLLGVAYEYLLEELAGSAGKERASFSTPRSIVSLMVRLLEPEEGMTVYDPCMGPGGTLTSSYSYLCEKGEDPDKLMLYGQESNFSMFSIAKLNMLFRNIENVDIRKGDTLAEPCHTQNGQIMRFDRILAHPPFSLKYRFENVGYPERFELGEIGMRKVPRYAGLLFVQHILASLKPGGKACIVLSNGFLFRVGAEREIRQVLVLGGYLEAVIGLPPNVFYGTGIPACVLVLRHSRASTSKQQDPILFINAEQEFESDRSQNRMNAAHLEKIVQTYQNCEEHPGYSVLASLKEVEDNDFNLSIPRYVSVDSSEFHDPCAFLRGGVPLVEVEGKQTWFALLGLRSESIFSTVDREYCQFLPSIAQKRLLGPHVENDNNVRAKKTAWVNLFHQWWTEQQEVIESLTKQNKPAVLRKELMTSLEKTLGPMRAFERFQILGATAMWWDDAKEALLHLCDMYQSSESQRFKGVVKLWLDNVEAEFQEQGRKGLLPRHPVVENLIPAFVVNYDSLTQQIEDVSLVVKSGMDGDEELSEEQVKSCKKTRASNKKKLKAMGKGFLEQLWEAFGLLEEMQAKELVFSVFQNNFLQSLEQQRNNRLQEFIALLEGWWDKYSVTLHDVEAKRVEAKARLYGYLEELGYL